VTLDTRTTLLTSGMRLSSARLLDFYLFF
jgi:hypothetical protein